MGYAHCERLTALDSLFLELEDGNAHMHVGAVALFDAAPLTGADGTTDIDRIRRLIEARIRHVPRYRQRLASVPLFGSPVWVDDERFNLNYHLRHVSLPKPGDERLLKRLAGRVMSQQLDRGKPLWELWLVDGVEGGRVALITKAHHCMIDGIGGVELSTALFRLQPNDEVEPTAAWMPRPAPSAWELLRGELARRAAAPLAALQTMREAAERPRQTASAWRDSLLGLGEVIRAALRPASPTPLNAAVGSHRRFDWLAMDLGAVQAVKRRLGGTINDVVLAVVSGALGRFLHRRGLAVEGLDFRAMIPVNVRSEAERGQLGNRVTSMVVRLPLGERDPCRRLERVRELVGECKRSKQALGLRVLEEVGDRTFASLFIGLTRMAALTHPYNVVVTNVPGPQATLYLLGSPMRAIYPLVPLFRDQALGIALFSYDGALHWGFNADWDALPDLHDIVEAVQGEFDLLANRADRPPAAAAVPARRAARGRRRASRRVG